MCCFSTTDVSSLQSFNIKYIENLILDLVIAEFSNRFLSFLLFLFCFVVFCFVLFFAICFCFCFVVFFVFVFVFFLFCFGWFFFLHWVELARTWFYTGILQLVSCILRLIWYFTNCMYYGKSEELTQNWMHTTCSVWRKNGGLLCSHGSPVSKVSLNVSAILPFSCPKKKNKNKNKTNKETKNKTNKQNKNTFASPTE